ncbi:DUF1080 domain-containing protein [bacterium]|jgi:hypothetical protein|nr:DUF1080 domain-containing protein [bacterium]
MPIRLPLVMTLSLIACASWRLNADEAVNQALIHGQGPGWRDMVEEDFTNVNVSPETASWKGPGEVHITGQPVGVIRTKNEIKNVELVVQWRHMKPAGNSGIFLWVPMASMKDLKPGGLPHGIEVQVLDLAFKDSYEKSSGKKADWFTCHGDVFPVGTSNMKPFPPVAPDGRRSFPTKELSKGVGLWNHYYVRAINGEVRLWVNGEEVSGGTACEPSVGYLCLESEGSPVEFRGLRIREIP